MLQNLDMDLLKEKVKAKQDSSENSQGEARVGLE